VKQAFDNIVVVRGIALVI